MIGRYSKSRQVIPGVVCFRTWLISLYLGWGLIFRYCFLDTESTEKMQRKAH